MGIVKCRECGKEKSSKAEVCPHCGVKKPKAKSMSLGSLLFLIIFGMIVYNMSTGDDYISSKSVKPAMTLIEKQAKEKTLVADLKKIPASEIFTNRNKYDDLVKLMPSNPKYQKKLAYYDGKIRQLEVKIGKSPTRSAWDGVPYSVERYVEKAAKDPDSVDFVSCTSTTYSEKGWHTTCQFRARNGFGGMSLEQWKFTIKHGQVIQANKS